MGVVSKRQKRELFNTGNLSTSLIPAGIPRLPGDFAESGTPGIPLSAYEERRMG